MKKMNKQIDQCNKIKSNDVGRLLQSVSLDINRFPIELKLNLKKIKLNSEFQMIKKKSKFNLC